MTDPVRPAVRGSMPAKLRDLRKRVPLQPLLRKDVASNGPAWPPLVWVLGGIATVAYADHLVVSISLAYLYIRPLGVGAIFLRREISYCLIAICILFHDYYSPRNINPGAPDLRQSLSQHCCALPLLFTSSSDHDRNMLEMVGRLNTGIHSVSYAVLFV